MPSFNCEVCGKEITKGYFAPGIAGAPPSKIKCNDCAHRGIRPDWATYFMRLAYVTAERASCLRKKVGALIVRDADKRIISGGYNGAPRGMVDCLTAGCDLRVIDGRESCVRTIHAESNALDLAGSVIMTPHTIYTTVIPCRLCALRIIQAGIKRCIYHEFYRSQGTDEVIALFAAEYRHTDDKGKEFIAHGPHRVELIHLDVPMSIVKPIYGEPLP